MPLIVNEIFHSIQGESTHAGRPCVFIRLTGCNLRCLYCDTVYAYDEGSPMDLDDIIRQVEAFGCPLVEITGGEPLAQEDTPDLVTRLLDCGFEVLMETNGSLNIDTVDRRCIRIMDIKCPSSGEHRKNDAANLNRLGPYDQIKFVIGDRDDFDFALGILKKNPPAIPSSQILFSTISGKVNPVDLAQWFLDSGVQARLQVQLHKIIWPGEERGV
jgi:7-carboxy-7-deazaguanine synthase